MLQFSPSRVLGNTPPFRMLSPQKFHVVLRGGAASSFPAPPPFPFMPIQMNLRHSQALPSQPWKRRSLAISWNWGREVPRNFLSSRDMKNQLRSWMWLEPLDNKRER